MKVTAVVNISQDWVKVADAGEAVVLSCEQTNIEFAYSNAAPGNAVSGHVLAPYQRLNEVLDANLWVRSSNGAAHRAVVSKGTP